MKKIVKTFFIVSFLLAGMFISIASSPAKVSAATCNDTTVIPVSASIDEVEFCKNRGGIATAQPTAGPLTCVDGMEVPLDAGISEDDFCKDKGGVSREGAGTNSSACSVVNGDSENGTKGCVVALNPNYVKGKYQCGSGKNAIFITFNIGCRGAADQRADLNPIWDMLFALMRFLIAGVGIAVIGSTIYGGIMYAASQGNPQATQGAIKRIQASIGALLLYIFAASLINWLVPGGLLS